MSDSSGFISPASTWRISLGLVATCPTFTSPRQAVEGHPVAFLQRLALTVIVLSFSSDDERARTDDRRLAHLASDDGGVRGHAAGCGENALRHFHAVDVVGHGLLPDEEHLLALRRPLHRVVRGEHHLARRRTGGRRQALGDDRQLLPLLRIEHGRQQLRQRDRLDQQQRLARRDEPLATKSVAMTTAA